MHILYNTIVLILGYIIPSDANTINPENNTKIESSIGHSFDEVIFPTWYLSSFDCDEYTYICCCEDVQRICYGSGTCIGCVPGGIFECLKEYSGSTPQTNFDCNSCCFVICA